MAVIHRRFVKQINLQRRRIRERTSRKVLQSSPLFEGNRGSRMFLTLLRLGKSIPGRQWIGKHRRPRAVTWQMKRNMLVRLEREAENEYWLSRPYMTPEQEHRHNAERRLQRYLDLKATNYANFPKHKHIADHLDHLNISKNWCN